MFGSQSGGGSLSIDGQQCHFEPDRVVHGDRPGCHGVHEPLHARHLVIKVWQLYAYWYLDRLWHSSL
ncbi:MAG: hypothetical protein ACYDC7_01635 [Acidithiobacillus ferrivorans]